MISDYLKSWPLWKCDLAYLTHNIESLFYYDRHSTVGIWQYFDVTASWLNFARRFYCTQFSAVIRWEMRQSHKTIVLKWYTRWNVPYRYFLTISPSKHSDLNQIFIPVKSNPIDEFPSSYRQKCDNFRIYKESIRVIKQGLRHLNLKPSQAVTSQKFQGSLKVYMLYGLSHYAGRSRCACMRHISSHSLLMQSVLTNPMLVACSAESVASLNILSSSHIILTLHNREFLHDALSSYS